MEPTAPTFRINNQGDQKRPLDSTGEPLLDNKLPRLEANALELSRLRKTPLDEAETSSNESWVVEATPRLDLLPEYVLRHLFSYLNTQDLYNISLCAPRLYNVARSEKKLWEKVMDVCNGSSPCHSRFLPFLNDCTTVLQFKSINNSSSSLAESHTDECFELNFLESLKSLSNLKSFILENHSLDYKMLNLALLPKSVTELRLKKINLLNLTRECTILHDLHQNLPNLEVVDVSFCLWVKTKMLISFSLCSRLKELILAGCSGMDSMIPYAADIDAGFPKLETLDLSYTSVNSFIEVDVFQPFRRKMKRIALNRTTVSYEITNPSPPSDRIRRLLNFGRRLRAIQDREREFQDLLNRTQLQEST